MPYSSSLVAQARKHLQSKITEVNTNGESKPCIIEPTLGDEKGQVAQSVLDNVLENRNSE